jgi:DNA-directed RNA polymerase specialized sigma24 family protein
LAKNYFDGIVVEAKIKELQQLAEQNKAEGKEPRDGSVYLAKEQIILKEIDKICNAIISVHGYYRFEEYDDLYQHARLNCWGNILKFTPEKGQAFDYFSIIAKRSLLNYTTRKEKHRGHQNIEMQFDLVAKNITNYDIFFDDLESDLAVIILEKEESKDITKNKAKNYLQIAQLLIHYLRQRLSFSKSEFYSMGRSYGLTNSQCREFLSFMTENSKRIFNGI